MATLSRHEELVQRIRQELGALKPGRLLSSSLEKRPKTEYHPMTGHNLTTSVPELEEHFTPFTKVLFFFLHVCLSFVTFFIPGYFSSGWIRLGLLLGYTMIITGASFVCPIFPLSIWTHLGLFMVYVWFAVLLMATIRLFFRTSPVHTPALQELHIFLAPIDPLDQEGGEELMTKYQRVCEMFNETYRDTYPHFKEMKPCHLALDFRTRGKFVSVMQSARYYSTDDPEEAVQEAYRDARLFQEAGFDVLRVKIEASAHGIDGIPETQEELTQAREYFEHHIKVCRKDAPVVHKGQAPPELAPLTAEEQQEEARQLKEISDTMSSQFKIPVPLSFNRNKYNDRFTNRGQQMFLNVRFRDCGVEEAKRRVKTIVDYINEHTMFRVVKSIDELVWYDDYPELDQGWIDFTPDEWSQWLATHPSESSTGKDDEEPLPPIPASPPLTPTSAPQGLEPGDLISGTPTAVLLHSKQVQEWLQASGVTETPSSEVLF